MNFGLKSREWTGPIACEFQFRSGHTKTARYRCELEPKSGKIDRRRCQYERGSTRKVHPGVSPGSSQTDHGGEAIFSGGRAPVIPGSLNTQLLSQSP